MPEGSGEAGSNPYGLGESKIIYLGSDEVGLDPWGVERGGNSSC